ncbi:ExbD/TolR family protein [Qipengyuania marisflavi]|uniref:Uncharacterized protein n=1 Tax=Qipengyuania marisflavi TaxID=2486356 RepID=A0A5S3P520_9SPHN|nr:hypothetical protein [Qipengyuania marisflavi]TMM48107.1 hypothetical protein FEV51_07325 [Qipengyuania marisflavi]
MIAATLSAATYGVQMQEVTIDLPHPSPSDAAISPLPIDELAVDSDGVAWWNNIAVGDAELRRILERRGQDNLLRGLTFRPAGNAQYGRSLRVLGLVKETANAEAGFCLGDLDLYRRLGDRPAADPHQETGQTPHCDPSRDGRLFAGPW